MDPDDPFDADDYLLFTDAVDYCRAHGIAVFAAAGNEHVRVDRVDLELGGRTLEGVGQVSLGAERDRDGLAREATPLDDYDLRGWLPVPGGVPGVTMVSATANAIGAAPADVPLRWRSHVGARDQLAYYSNYGSRIDLAAPGGARRYQIPGYDGGDGDILYGGWGSFGALSDKGLICTDPFSSSLFNSACFSANGQASAGCRAPRWPRPTRPVWRRSSSPPAPICGTAPTRSSRASSGAPRARMTNYMGPNDAGQHRSRARRHAVRHRLLPRRASPTRSRSPTPTARASSTPGRRRPITAHLGGGSRLTPDLETHISAPCISARRSRGAPRPVGEVPRGTRTRPESTCAAAARAVVPHRSRHTTKGRVDDTNTHERPGSDDLPARRGTCVDPGSPDRTLVRRERSSQARRRRRRRGEQGDVRRRRAGRRLRGVPSRRSRTYPANVISPAIVKRAQTTFSRIAKRDARFAKTARGRHFLDNNGGKWEQYGPRTYAPRARRDLVLGSDERHREPHRRARGRPGLHGEQVPRLGRRLGRRRLDDGQRPRAGPGVEADEPGAARPELGRAAGARSDRQEARHALPRHRRGNRCSSGCEAGVGIYKSTDGGKHWKKLDDTCVSNATYACVNPGKDAFLGRGINGDRDRPARRESHPRRLGPGRPRPLAHDRQRRDDPPRAGRERARASTSRSTAARRSPRSGTGTSAGRLRRHRRRPRPARTRTPSTRPRSTRVRGGATRERPPTAFQQVFAPQFNQGARDRPARCSR